MSEAGAGASDAGELDDLQALAHGLGVHTHFVDGLGREVTVADDTLVRVCAALGAPIRGPGDARDARRDLAAARAEPAWPLVCVAWDGVWPDLDLPAGEEGELHLTLEDGATPCIGVSGGLPIGALPSLPMGYHTLRYEGGSGARRTTIISAPVESWHPDERGVRSARWGLGTHLAALRSARSRSIGDVRDLETLGRWIAARGGDVVSVLPLLPTFDAPPAEPSPYAPVSRLFWSERSIDLGAAHRPVPPPARLDVSRARTEVRAALMGRAIPDVVGGAAVAPELAAYARFRGAQARLGRDWRRWPQGPRDGRLRDDQVDPDEERFHIVAQSLARQQLEGVRHRLSELGVSLGLDLSVGVHPDGYDPWSRRALFAEGMSVGAPPDLGFPSGQDWGFPPVLPEASRRDGHRYAAAAIRHQAAVAGVLRVDHVMAFQRLYWIPRGAGLHDGTYVDQPTDELFAVLVLESHRHRCEVVGENLGTVPPTMASALERHRVPGMALAIFAAGSPEPPEPRPDQVAFVDTHDTPTFAGWVAGCDIEARVGAGLLDAEAVPGEHEARAQAVHRLAAAVGSSPDETPGLFEAVLDWLGRSESPLVLPWIEDLWLEPDQVNLPGTTSAERPNWQRPMARVLDDVLADPAVERRVRLLREARATREAAATATRAFVTGPRLPEGEDEP